MRHRVSHAKLNRDTDHRKAMNRFMATSFISVGHITTTLAKAKYVQPYIEQLVTKAKVSDTNTIRHLKASLDTRETVDYLLQKVAPKFVSRPGGYTRIVKLGYRVGDNAPLARLEWVEKFEVDKKTTKDVKKSKAPVKESAKTSVVKVKEKVSNKNLKASKVEKVVKANKKATKVK